MYISFLLSSHSILEPNFKVIEYSLLNLLVVVRSETCYIPDDQTVPVFYHIPLLISFSASGWSHDNQNFLIFFMGPVDKSEMV